MPALPAVPKVVRVDHHYSGEAATNIQIRQFFQYSGSLSTTDATTWLTNITTAMATWVVARFVTGCNLVSSTLTDLTSATSPQVSNTTSALGANGTDILPEGVAMVLKQRIVRRYRGGHPRIYMPGQRQAAVQTNGLWNPATTATWVSDYNTYLAACTAGTNPAAIGTITHVNVSYFSGFTNKTYPSGRIKPVPTPRVSPVVDTVISVSANPQPASQRRRNIQSK